ncbi:hypothetical protein ElyMa_000027700 [Elysia marginata]|uniref:Uncharacterized protein n=1 Tax=Elysia marginata TaxID=1093978 RepID=A0AAV4ECF9_9GAST|nr:hypothetical protein ElyMa_000027700 [Elysia marginata]
MEFHSVASPPYTGFLQRFDPQFYFNRRNTPVVHVVGGFNNSSVLPPLLSSPPDSSNSKTPECQRHVLASTHPVVPTPFEPKTEPLDLSTSRTCQRKSPFCNGLEDPATETSSSEKCVLGLSARSDNDSPAKIVTLKFCECFTGKYQIGDYFACYCNGIPVYTPRSRLLPLLEEKKTDEITKNVSSPSLTFSSLDPSPPALVIDLSSSLSETEEKEHTITNDEANRNAPDEAHSLSQEARRIYNFESDEELKSLGTFSNFRFKAENSEAIILKSSSKQKTQPEESGLISTVSTKPSVYHLEHQTPLSSNMNITQNFPVSPQVLSLREEESTAADSVDSTQVLVHERTQDYNADVSNSQLTGHDSESNEEVLNDSIWFVKHDLDKTISPLKLKLCKTFVVSDLDKVTVENQSTVIAQPLADSGTTETNLSRDIFQSTSSSPNTNTVRRYVEGRSICEASTIVSISPTPVTAATMFSCISYPVTPDISFHASATEGDVHNLSLAVTPTGFNPSITANRKSSTPNLKGPIKRQNTCKTTKQVEHTSLSKAMFQKKLSTQGSDSILNLGFTSDLKINQQNSVPPQINKPMNDAGVLKKPKPKKTAIFKGLRQRIMCQNNLSVMSTLENTELEEPSCSERVKAALGPLAAKSKRFHGLSRLTIKNAMCGKTATTSTATVTFATLNETKQFASTGHPNSAPQSTEHTAAPAFTMFSSLRSLGSSTLNQAATCKSSAYVYHPLKPSNLRDGSSCQFVANQNSHDYNTAMPVKSATLSGVESSPFKIPKVPQTSTTPFRGHRIHPHANLADTKQQQKRNYSGSTTAKESVVRARLPSESSPTESNGTARATQQSFDFKELKRSARGVAELLTAFITDASIAQFGAQFQDAKSKSMV